MKTCTNGSVWQSQQHWTAVERIQWPLKMFNLRLTQSGSSLAGYTGEALFTVEVVYCHICELHVLLGSLAWGWLPYCSKHTHTHVGNYFQKDTTGPPLISRQTPFGNGTSWMPSACSILKGTIIVTAQCWHFSFFLSFFFLTGYNFLQHNNELIPILLLQSYFAGNFTLTSFSLFSVCLLHD